MPLLEVSHLTKRFGGLTAVDQVSFSIDQGEILGLIGPNGAGKTTLFNCIVGFYRFDEGTVKFRGKDVSRLSSDAICKLGMARTFQIVKSFKGMTVLENTMVASLLRASRVEQARREALEVLKLAGLNDKRDVDTNKLTVEDKKRLEIARAMATKPTLLVLDEVMAGLSPTETREAVELIRKIHQAGITVFLVEHVMEVVMPLSHRIIVLDSGRKITEGAPTDVVNDPNVIRVYLGEKYHARSKRNQSLL